MPKNSNSQSSNQQDSKQQKNSEKPKTVFDHIKHIRETKSHDYFDKLTTAEKNNFNKYVILMGLSMDQNAINAVSYISKYLDILSCKQMYKLCCALVPRSSRYCKWIKSSKPKFGRKLLGIISSYYKIGRYEAYDYCTIFFKDEANIQKLIELCTQLGYNEEEIESILGGSDE